MGKITDNWIRHVEQTMAANAGGSLKEILKYAKKTYKYKEHSKRKTKKRKYNTNRKLKKKKKKKKKKNR